MVPTRTMSRPGDPLVLRQTLWFCGWHGFWLVGVPMPDIASPGALPP